MSKNIVVFSDGTGQDGGTGPDTNVHKIFKAAEDRTDDQILFYDKGIGTGPRWLSAATGFGISKNILECYKFIFENYTAGDKIYLFGFSRGATTVRSLSGFIHHFGILPKSRPELIKKAYKIYQIQNEEKRERAAEDFRARHHPMWVKVEFLGVWDTVSALGVPMRSISNAINKIPFFGHTFHELTLSESVIKAYHALSIDDGRDTFHPELWNCELKEGQSMEQVWFAGVHTDVGGGYPDDALSEIPLHWMLNKAIKSGLRLHHKQILELKGDPNGFMHDSRKGWRRIYKKAERSWTAKDQYGLERDKPVVHPSVLQRNLDTTNQKSTGYKPWILQGDFSVAED